MQDKHSTTTFVSVANFGMNSSFLVAALGIFLQRFYKKIEPVGTSGTFTGQTSPYQ